MNRVPFDKTPTAVAALMQRASHLERAWRTIKIISDPLYARTEKRDGKKWKEAAKVLESEGVEVPNSGHLVWG